MEEQNRQKYYGADAALSYVTQGQQAKTGLGLINPTQGLEDNPELLDQNRIQHF